MSYIRQVITTLSYIVRPKQLIRRLYERRERELLSSSSLFDERWYLQSYPDVAESGIDPIIHYLRSGAAEGRCPSESFDTQLYLQSYDDVREAKTNPLVHFIRFGQTEGRKPSNFLSLIPSDAQPRQFDQPAEPVEAPFALNTALHAEFQKAKSPNDSRPTILVLPAFFAVGGVERNTAAIMETLSRWFRFVLVTNELHTPESGCLFQEIQHCVDAIFDLAKLSSREHHIDLLTEIAKQYPPDLVWICNGSVWLHQNFEQIFAIFSNTPIVDQQVYDVDQGWINHITPAYAERVSRFIAINDKIREKFISINIPRERVDLIYPAVDLSRLIDQRRLQSKGRETRVYAMICRFSEQKRPLDFIALADRFAGKDLLFKLVGNGPLRGDCEREIASRGLHNIKMVPFSSDIASIYQMIDGLIIMSEYEGLPIVMLEALSLGVPVLSTDVGDILRVGKQLEPKSVVVVPEAIGRPHVFSEALAEFDQQIRNHQKAAALSADMVRSRFSAEAISTKYFETWSCAWQAYAEADFRAWN